MSISNKTLYIVRGLPGSGKTTLATALVNHQDWTHAADDFFYDKNGIYEFNPELLPMAHANCHDAVEEDMDQGVSKIAVHNTFSQRWEVEPYYELAVKYGYFVVVIECQNNFGSAHGVPQSSIDAMAARWETLGPVPQTAQGRKEREERKMQTEDDVIHESICLETCDHHEHKCPQGFECEPHEDLEENEPRWKRTQETEGNDEGHDHPLTGQPKTEIASFIFKRLAQEHAQELDEELDQLLSNPRMLEQPSGWCGGEDGSTSWEDHLIDLLQGHRERYMSEIRDREAQAESSYDVVRKINIKLIELEKIQKGI